MRRESCRASRILRMVASILLLRRLYTGRQGFLNTRARASFTTLLKRQVVEKREYRPGNNESRCAVCNVILVHRPCIPYRTSRWLEEQGSAAADWTASRFKRRFDHDLLGLANNDNRRACPLSPHLSDHDDRSTSPHPLHLRQLRLDHRDNGVAHTHARAGASNETAEFVGGPEPEDIGTGECCAVTLVCRAHWLISRCYRSISSPSTFICAMFSAAWTILTFGECSRLIGRKRWSGGSIGGRHCDTVSGIGG